MDSKVEPSGGKRKPPNAGKGRKKGVPNKITQSAKEAFQAAFDSIGGAKNLATWARDNETEFYKIYSRLIPVEQRLADPNGDPIKIAVEFVSARPSTLS